MGAVDQVRADLRPVPDPVCAECSAAGQADSAVIGRWVAEMRRRQTAGELRDEQRARIDALPGWRRDA